VIEARSLDLLELNEISRDIRTDGNRIKVKYKNRDILTISVRGLNEKGKYSYWRG